MEKNKIIYILGLGRSGSTLVTSILNCHSEIVGVGEVNNILMKYDIAKCSCGNTLETCTFWNNIFTRINKKTNYTKEDIRKIIKNQESKENFFNPLKNKDEKYVPFNKLFYDEVRKESGFDIIVDSSKNIMRYFSLKKDVNITTITVIRNPFGVCWSLLKINKNSPNLIKYIIYSLLSYTFNNLFILLLSLFDKNMIVFKYENMNNIVKSKTFWDKLNLKESYSQDKEYHIGFGNDLIYNFNVNDFVYKEDKSYQQNLSWKWKIVVYILCWPIILLKGYKF